METIQNKCPSCGSNLVFDIETGGLKCRHCGTTTDFNDTEVVQRRELCDSLLSGYQKWTEARVFACSNCGAKEVLEDKTIARKCAFCGSAQVASIDELPGIRPDSVIPFQVTESGAVTRFKQWMRGRWLAPGAFRNKKNINKQMNKLYSPCWSFSSKTINQYSGTLGRTITVSSRNGTRTQVRWFRVVGNIAQNYNDKLYQSGERINSIRFNKLKPYNLAQLKVYRQEYLSGIIAEHYTKTLEQCFREFSMFVKKDVRNRVVSRYRADVVGNLDIQTNFTERRFNYILLPLYISNYTYKGKLYNFYINGATGKVTGRYPRSFFKIMGIVLGVAAVVIGVGVGLWFSGILK